jgi:hypothetical protein
MSKGNTFENDLMQLIFNGMAIPGIADNAGTSPLTDLFVSLHTADPGETGTQTTNEATYGSYARVAVQRDAGGWTVTANSAENAALVQFPQCTSGTNTITHVAVGETTSGVGNIFYKGALSASLSVSSGIQPQFAAGSLVVSED